MHLTDLILLNVVSVTAKLVPLRPPCTPLNVVSPYQSTWSCTDALYDDWPRHWNGDTVAMYGAIRVDSSLFRFMGAGSMQGRDASTAVQYSTVVSPTTTSYFFEAGGIALEINFMTPAFGLDDDIVTSSRPVTHMTFKVASLDKKEHDVQVYYDNSAEGAVMNPNETVSWSRRQCELFLMTIGTTEQKPLGQRSDRINWGQWIVATPKDAAGVHTVMNDAQTCRGAFASGTYFTVEDDLSGPRPASERWPVLSVAWDLGKVSEVLTERHLMLAYDQVISQHYFGTDMAPLWKNRWADASAMLIAAESTRINDLAAAAAFDKSLVANLTAMGGDKYATLASLAYRQVTGGTQAVWNPIAKEAWVFMKEISSDGDVSTVDVIYPAFPMFQYLYPEYFRRILLPLMVYASNTTGDYGIEVRYNLAWAPHHLGTWPVCDLPPQNQEQMPVEESGNMLIMIYALYKKQGSLEYLTPYWSLLLIWADFIAGSLPDPGNQLCTDDFEGPSPHNTNLAAKGIVALEAYAELLKAKGDAVLANKYRQLAFGFAKTWVKTAADHDHYRIQFNLPGTWSQKYNLLWQRVLGLKAFPEAVFDQETAYYHTKLQRCGVPLDSRHPYTKSDWSLWSASLAKDPKHFRAIAEATFTFVNETPSRMPLPDWYDVGSCNAMGFRARPVQGGFFAKMLVVPDTIDGLGEATTISLVPLLL